MWIGVEPGGRVPCVYLREAVHGLCQGQGFCFPAVVHSESES